MEDELNQKVYARALKLLAHKPYSEAELQTKLAKYGDAVEIAKVIEKLKALNLVDDLNFSRSFASYRVRTKLFGRVRAAKDLKSRHVPAHIIDQALDEVFREAPEAEVIDMAVEKWVSRHGTPRTQNELKSLYDYLRRQGFPYRLIYDKIRAYDVEYEPRDSDYEEST
jgi:regulatory protein